MDRRLPKAFLSLVATLLCHDRHIEAFHSSQLSRPRLVPSAYHAPRSSPHMCLIHRLFRKNDGANKCLIPRSRGAGKILSSLKTREAPHESDIDVRRRLLLSRSVFSVAFLSAFSCAAQPCHAGEFGEKITAAVTQSDIGVSVRRSVVKGAQVMDKLDGKWEKFSDDFNLGAERSKRDARPKPKDVPDLLPLDEKAALSILKASDSVFLSIVPVGETALSAQVQKVDELVRKSFERSGLSFDGPGPMSAPFFNYLCYVHFKAYSDLLIERNVNFNQFRQRFENTLGNELIGILTPNVGNFPADVNPDVSGASPSSRMKKRLETALYAVDRLSSTFTSKGFVALIERSEMDQERIDVWSEDIADLQFSVALDGDITMNSQILLQEQGFRLYPDFARFAFTSAFRTVFDNAGQEVTSDEYYMDTNYSSDPNLFEAKQVLLNFVIDSK